MDRGNFRILEDLIGHKTGRKAWAIGREDV